MAKQGLEYFPKMVNFYEDDKIFDLLDEYGPLGVTIYDCILSIVYANGYYANLSKDKLSRMVIRKIGNKWIKNQKVVVQVIDYCADLGLFDRDLMLRNIITSVGIQTRFYKVAVKLMKRQLHKDKYWLLDENGEPLLNSPIFVFSSEEIRISSEENGQSSEENTVKEKERKEKETKYKYWESSELNRAVDAFITHRKAIHKPLEGYALNLFSEELNKLSNNVEEQINILNQSIVNGWTGIFPLKKTQKEKGIQRSNRFHNFSQRDTDYNAIVLERIRQETGGGNDA